MLSGIKGKAVKKALPAGPRMPSEKYSLVKGMQLFAAKPRETGIEGLSLAWHEYISPPLEGGGCGFYSPPSGRG